MYKDKLSTWGLFRNIREDEMQYIARIKSRHDAMGKRTRFSIRGRRVEASKIDRWIRKERKALGDQGFKTYLDSDGEFILTLTCRCDLATKQRSAHSFRNRYRDI